jgi:uncharacterized membrane protein
LSAPELPRRAALVMLAATAVLIAAWLGGPALAHGAAGVAAVAALLAPLALGIHGLWRSQLRTGRWLSLVLPFYGAGFLIAAVGNPEARGWVTTGAFFVALAFAAAISWVRRAAPQARPR